MAPALRERKMIGVKKTTVSQTPDPTRANPRKTASPRIAAPKATSSKITNFKVTTPKRASLRPSLMNLGTNATNAMSEASDDSQSDDEHVAMVLNTTSSLGDVQAQVYMNHGDHYAKYNTERRRFALTSTLDSKDPFALERTTFTSGPFKGYQALVLVPVPKHQLPFLDLPPEIRNMVYLALLAPDGYRIQLGGRSAKTYYGIFEVIDSSSTVRAGTGRRNYEYKSLVSNLGILSVCKEVNAEATSILYGCNEFYATGPYAFKRFADKVGSGRVYLRNFVMDPGYSRYSSTFASRLRSSMKMLADSQNLVRLHINIRHVYPSYSWYSDGLVKGSSVARDLQPVIKSLVCKGRSESEILDVITFLDGKPSPPDFEKFFEEYKAGLSEYLKTLEKAEMALKEKEAREKARCKEVKAKGKKVKVEPAIRRDTGRAKRKGYTDVVKSYVEIEEDDGDFEEDGDVEVEDRDPEEISESVVDSDSEDD